MSEQHCTRVANKRAQEKSTRELVYTEVAITLQHGVCIEIDESWYNHIVLYYARGLLQMWK